jgi:hypothetical protein
MARVLTLETTLERHGEIAVTYVMQPSDPDVGIMSAYPEVTSVVNAAGIEIELTDTELESLDDRLCEHAYDEDDDPDLELEEEEEDELED